MGAGFVANERPYVLTALSGLGGRRPGGASDATPGLAKALSVTGQDWREACSVDTTGPLTDSIGVAESLWRDMV